jgi:hypothetical protein
MQLCDYGCGHKGIYQFKNGKWCCSLHYSSCEGVKNKRPRHLSLEHKNKIKKALESKDVRERIRQGNIGEKNPNWKGGYDKKELCRYDQYSSQLSYAEKVRRNSLDSNILEVTCVYCGEWFVPKKRAVIDRISCMTRHFYGECRFYCSKNCKTECPIYNQVLYPKNFQGVTSGETQAELRKIRFKIDNYTCQKCGKNKSSTILHCHHIEGIHWEPLESADIDKVVTLCKDCHIEVHKQTDCGYNDLQCK